MFTLTKIPYQLYKVDRWGQSWSYHARNCKI